MEVELRPPKMPPPVQLTGPLALIMRALSPLPSVPPLQVKRELMDKAFGGARAHQGAAGESEILEGHIGVEERIAPERGGVDDCVVGGAGGGAVVGVVGFGVPIVDCTP